MNVAKLSISQMRMMYDQYCESGIGDLDTMLHQAMCLLEAANAKIAEERQSNAELRIHLNRLRNSILDMFDQPLEYQAAPIAPIDTIAPSLPELLRHIHLRMP